VCCCWRLFELDKQASILDDATPLLVISDKKVTDGNSGGSKSTTMVMRLSGRSDQTVTVTVDVETADNTATADQDDEPVVPTTIRFAPGRTDARCRCASSAAAMPSRTNRLL
jgi:hypothetical protein